MLCSRCNKEADKCVSSFGKQICLECRNNRPNKGNGNSGLFSTGQSQFYFGDKRLDLQCVPKSDGLFGKLYFEHYPKSKGIVGRCINYLIYYDNNVVGIIGAASPPKGYKIFREYFNNADETYFVNNNVFRLTDNIPNLGTQVLKVFRQYLYKDYGIKYSQKLMGIVTFVEMPRTGALYKADNWDYLGITQGKRMYRRGENWEKQFVDGEKKYIFGYKYK